VKIGFTRVSDDDHVYEESVEEEQDEDVRCAAATAAAAAAAADDDDDDNEYFEDVMPSSGELQRQVVGMIGESLFNRVFSVVKVMLFVIGC